MSDVCMATHLSWLPTTMMRTSSSNLLFLHIPGRYLALRVHSSLSSLLRKCPAGVPPPGLRADHPPDSSFLSQAAVRPQSERLNRRSIHRSL